MKQGDDDFVEPLGGEEVQEPVKRNAGLKSLQKPLQLNGVEGVNTMLRYFFELPITTVNFI